MQNDFLHSFFHPDFNRRLWIFTKSADLYLKERALAGSFTLSKNTAGGELHPALKQLCKK
jgi:hypothetical protein